MEASPERRVVLDAYPVLALLRDEPCAAEAAEIVAGGSSVISTVTVAEVADVLVRVHDEDASRVGMTLESLLVESMAVEQPATDVAIRAGLVRAHWYRRRERELSLGDCFVLATARTGDAIATADPIVAEVARGEGLEVVALPDSSGRRP